MKIPPSLRPKKRYIAFRILTSQTFSPTIVQETVEKALERFLGQLGIAQATPLFLREKYKNQTFIIKVSHRWVDECKLAVILIKSIDRQPVIIQSIRTSGTLKKASEV